MSRRAVVTSGAAIADHIPEEREQGVGLETRTGQTRADAMAAGHEAINEAVETLLANLPPAFVFTAQGAAIGHHGLARLRWASGPPTGPAAATGTDVAHVAGGRIHSLYVLLDPAGA